MAVRRSQVIGNTTIRLEPYGSQTLSAFNILNFRANKDFRMSGGRRLSIDFDLFNLLNLGDTDRRQFLVGSDFRLRH